MSEAISAEDGHPRKRVPVLDSEMSYVETGAKGPPVVFLHGNPTSSYLWRNVISPVALHARCLAPDLIGMGQSGKAPDGSYRFADHARYLNAWFNAVLPESPLVLVGHDWGGALAFHWGQRHPERVAGIAYMETIVCPLLWEDWPEEARGIFQALRSPMGEELILEKNVFVERILPSAIGRDLTDAEMAAYRAPFAEPGEVRRPTLTWPREIPLDGEPEAVMQGAIAYGAWLASSQVPKLYVNAEPGSILVGRQRELCRGWPNQKEVTVKGHHFIQEDSPAEIGQAVAEFVQEIA